MPKRKQWKEWGLRFRERIRDKKINLRTLAERLELAESTVRSWINGNREINLSDFFRLCQAGNIDPSQVLFGTSDDNFLAIAAAWEQADDQGKNLLRIAAEAVTRGDESKQKGTASAPHHRG